MQRFFDIVFSGIALVLLSPILLPLMFILRVTGEGEIFFPQSRVGRGDTTFERHMHARARTRAVVLLLTPLLRYGTSPSCVSMVQGRMARRG